MNDVAICLKLPTILLRREFTWQYICFLYLLQSCGASNWAEMCTFIWNVNGFAQLVMCFTSFDHTIYWHVGFCQYVRKEYV